MAWMWWLVAVASIVPPVAFLGIPLMLVCGILTLRHVIHPPRPVRVVSIGVVAAVPAAAALAVMARAAMRVTAIVEGRAVVFTSETTFIVVLSLAMGTILGAVLALVRDAMGWRHNRWALGLVAALSLGVFLPITDTEVTLAARLIGGLPSFMATFFVFGYLIERLNSRLERGIVITQQGTVSPLVALGAASAGVTALVLLMVGRPGG